MQTSSLLRPQTSESPQVAQPAIRSGDDHCSLTAGTHGLGGRAPDALPLSALQKQPRAATLTVSDDGTTVLQRTSASIVVRIDGETIGVAPVDLHHGAKIECGECRLTFERDVPALRPARRSKAAAVVEDDGERLLTLSVAESSGSTSTPPACMPSEEPMTSAALVAMGSGARHPLPARRIYIGRDDSCDVVVRGNNVSRRHASIVPVANGFMLRDESANGTLVNGVRIVGTYLLGNGDVVRVQDEELRVELDASAPPAVMGGEQTTLLDISHITRGIAEEQAAASANRALTASLEIVRGQFSGACFQIDRAVCSIGRGDENDVRIRDDTVSLTHATLLRKREAWFVVDLRSLNGTFVDGSRVSGERELHPGSRVRVGSVELVFRAIDSESREPIEVPRPGAWRRLREIFRSVAPPSAAR